MTHFRVTLFLIDNIWEEVRGFELAHSGRSERLSGPRYDNGIDCFVIPRDALVTMKKKGSLRVISTARLSMSPYVHLPPINVVVFYDP